MSKKVEYTLNTPLRGYKAGQKLNLEVDENGTPIDKYWRRRLRDAKIDGCITKTEQSKSKPLSEKDKI